MSIVSSDFLETSDAKAQALTAQKVVSNKSAFGVLSNFVKEKFTLGKIARKFIPYAGQFELVADFITLGRELSHSFSLTRVLPRSSLPTQISFSGSTNSFQEDFASFSRMLNENFAASRNSLNELSSNFRDLFNAMNENNVASAAGVASVLDRLVSALERSTEASALIAKNRAQQDLLNVQIANRQVKASENAFSSLERKLDSLIEAVKRNETRIINNVRPQAQPQAQAQKPELKVNTADIVQSLNRIADRSNMLSELQRMNTNLAKLKNQEITVKSDNADVVQALDKLKQSLDIKSLIKKVGGIGLAFEALLELLKRDGCITEAALKDLFAPQREFYEAQNEVKKELQENTKLEHEMRKYETTKKDFKDLDGNTVASNKTPQEVKSDEAAAQLRWKTDQLNLELDPVMFDDLDLALPEAPSLTELADNYYKRD